MESTKGDIVSTKRCRTLPKNCGSQSSEWDVREKIRAKRGSLCARCRSRKTVACHGLRVVEPVCHQASLRGRWRSWRRWRRNGRRAGSEEARLVNLAKHVSWSVWCCFFRNQQGITAADVFVFFLERDSGVRCHFRSEVSCGSSVASESWASQDVEAGLVELSRGKTHFCHDEARLRSMLKRQVCYGDGASASCRYRHERRCSEASLVPRSSHNTHFLVHEFLCFSVCRSRLVDDAKCTRNKVNSSARACHCTLCVDPFIFCA